MYEGKYIVACRVVETLLEAREIARIYYGLEPTWPPTWSPTPIGRITREDGESLDQAEKDTVQFMDEHEWEELV